MRNTDQRVQAALQGAQQIQRKRGQRRIQALAITASLCLVVLISLVIPTLVREDLSGLATSGFSASVFAGPQTLSYIIIGILSFVLGICVTILCLLLRQKQTQEDTNHEP